MGYMDNGPLNGPPTTVPRSPDPAQGGIAGGAQFLPQPPGTTFDPSGSPQFTPGQYTQGQVTSQLYGSQDPLQQATGIWQGYYAPQEQALQNSTDNLVGRQFGLNAGYDQSSAAANAQYQASLGLLGLDQRATGQQLAANAKEYGLYDQQTAIYRQLYNQMQNQAGLEGAQQRWGINSDATGKGAWGSQGQRENLNTSTLTEQSRQAMYENQFGIQQNQNEISKARLDAQRATLQSTADSYGLKSDQLKAQLDSGLAKLGLDQLMNTGQIMDMIDSNDINQATIGRQILEHALNTPQDVLSVLGQNQPGYYAGNGSVPRAGVPQ